MSWSCSSSDDLVLVPRDGGDRSDAAASNDDAGGEAEPASPLRECPLARGLEPFAAASCPGLGQAATSCPTIGARCIAYDQEGDGWFACMSECRASRTWSFNCDNDCGHTCAEPPVGAVVVELDTSDCARRALIACNEGPLTLQSQLDAQVASLLTPETFRLTDLADDMLVVHFENGCPTRYFAQESGRALPIVGGMLNAQLARLRLACAIALECAEFAGPPAE